MLICAAVMNRTETTEEMVNSWDQKSYVSHSSDGHIEISQGGAFQGNHVLNCCCPCDELVVWEGNGECPEVEMPTKNNFCF